MSGKHKTSKRNGQLSNESPAFPARGDARPGKKNRKVAYRMRIIMTLSNYLVEEYQMGGGMSSDSG
jgi:hypothetical protein